MESPIGSPKETPKKKIFFKPNKGKIADPSAQIDKMYHLPKVKTVEPKLWELPNRKGFPNWVFENYKVYQAQKNSLKAQQGDKLDYFKHQKLVRDYLQKDSPYRGILLYHGLGVGKTCASIAIAEGFRSDRKIAIILNKSLKQNFIVNLMKCGFEYFKINQHWEFKEITDSDVMYKFAKFLGINEGLIKKNKGAWFVNYSKKANYESLSTPEQTSLTEQINKMIEYANDSLNYFNNTHIMDKINNICKYGTEADAQIHIFNQSGFEGLRKYLMDNTECQL